MPLLLADRAVKASPLPLVTTDEARMLGIRLSGHRWLRVRRGIYVDRAAFEALAPWKRYAVRVHAFARQHPEVTLCLESAAVVHGLPHFGETEYIHVCAPERMSSRRQGDVFVHRSMDPRSVERIHGMLVTSLLDTVVDLARVMRPADALAVVDSSISTAQGGILTLDEMRSRAEEQQNQRGRAQLRWAWAHADGRSESPSESVSRVVISWSGFEVPVLQQKFDYEGVSVRVDFYFPSCRAIGEADGWQKYQLDEPGKAAQLLAEEKRREDRLRRHRHPFARWDLADAWKVAPVQRALELAGVPRVRATQPMMLSTLLSRPRAKAPVPRKRV